MAQMKHTVATSHVRAIHGTSHFFFQPETFSQVPSLGSTHHGSCKYDFTCLVPRKKISCRILESNFF